MRQIRNGVFETNSSSVHTLTIGKYEEIDECDWTPIFQLRENPFRPEYLKDHKVLYARWLYWDRVAPDFEYDNASFKLSYLYSLLGYESEIVKEDSDYRSVALINQKYEWNEWKHHNLETFISEVEEILSKYDIKIDWQTTECADEYAKRGMIGHQSLPFAHDLMEYVCYSTNHYPPENQREREEKADFENRLLNYLFNPNVSLEISCDG